MANDSNALLHGNENFSIIAARMGVKNGSSTLTIHTYITTTGKIKGHFLLETNDLQIVLKAKGKRTFHE